jgi:signal transduction histidine kinase
MMLMTLVVAVIAVACVGLLARHFTVSEFHQFITKNEAIDLDRLRALLMEHYRQRGSWEEAQPLLDRIAATTDEQLILVDAQRRALATSPAELLQSRIHVSPEHNLSWQREERGGGKTTVEQMELREVPHVVLNDPSGVVVGTLYAIPPPRMDGGGNANLFVSGLNRTLLWAALASAVVALIGAFVLSRRIVRPVEALTSAVRKMERGDLSQHVNVASKDEVGELAQAFNSMADKLAHAEQLRRNMVNDVAHELRTPLTNIRCQIEALQDGIRLPSPEVINSLHEEAMLLNRLIDDLQELSLAEAGQLTLNRERVSVASEIDSAVKAMQRSGAGAPPITMDVPQDCPDVLADAGRFAQVLRNLLANAMTHTPGDGSIAILARQLDSYVEVTIEDTGAGVPPEDLPYVFERFYRADHSRNRATGGAGLGLAICKQIVTGHGGEMRIESTPGKGTKIHFTLPIYALRVSRSVVLHNIFTA